MQVVRESPTEGPLVGQLRRWTQALAGVGVSAVANLLGEAGLGRVMFREPGTDRRLSLVESSQEDTRSAGRRPTVTLPLCRPRPGI